MTQHSEPAHSASSSVICQTTNSRGSSWLTWGLLAVIGIGGLLLRLQGISSLNYWFDESFGWKMTTFSYPELLERVGRDVHPPLYFLLLKIWKSLWGDSPAILRSLSVLFGVLTILGTFFLVREIAHGEIKNASKPRNSDTSALMAAAFVAVSPIHLIWAPQVKMYTLGTALAVWSSWLLMKALRESDFKVRAWSLYTIAAILLAYTHYYALFLILAQYLYALGYAIRHRKSVSTNQSGWTTVVASAFAVYLAWSPWLLVFLDQKAQVRQNYWIQPFEWQAVANACYQLFVSHNQWIPSPVISGIAAQLCFLLVLALLLTRRSGYVFISLAAIVPLLISVGFSYFGHNVFVTRFLIFAQVFFLSGLALLLGLIPKPLIRNGTFLVLLSASLWTSYDYVSFQNVRAEKPGMPVAIQHLKKVRTSGELVLVCNPMLYTNVAAYARDQPGMYAYGSVSNYPHYQGTPVMRDDEYFDAEQLQNSSANWVWTVDANRWFNGIWKVPMPPGWVQEGEQRFDEWYCEIVLRLYRRTNPSDKTGKTSEAIVVDRTGGNN